MIGDFDSVGRQVQGLSVGSNIPDELELTRRVAVSEIPAILLEGRAGAGKVAVARILHEYSRRSNQPFVAVNCAADADALLERELLGCEALSDARGPKKGLLEVANNGTLFLDEIGELPLELQARLLGVLDDRTFRRLGGVEEIQSDVRLVATTSRDLNLAIARGAFREDLYYRVSVIQLYVPSGCEWRSGIVQLRPTLYRTF